MSALTKFIQSTDDLRALVMTRDYGRRWDLQDIVTEAEDRIAQVCAQQAAQGGTYAMSEAPQT